jgi:hypothetical protein
MTNSSNLHSNILLIASIFRTGHKNNEKLLKSLQQGTELHAFFEMDSKFMKNFSNVRREVLIASIFRTGLKIR